MKLKLVLALVGGAAAILLMSAGYKKSSPKSEDTAKEEVIGISDAEEANFRGTGEQDVRKGKSGENGLTAVTER